MSQSSHDQHVTARVAIPCVAVFLILTSTVFASIVWSVMLMMIVCVPCLSGLAGLFLVLNHRAGGTWRPGVSKPAVENSPRRGQISTARRRAVDRVTVPGVVVARRDERTMSRRG